MSAIETAVLRSDLNHLAADTSAKANTCRELGKLSAAAKLREAHRLLQEAAEQLNSTDERQLHLHE